MESKLCLKEFPDYGPSLDFELPAGFYETSWCDDMCPSWSCDTWAPGYIVMVWCDYDDTDKREYSGSPRFKVSRYHLLTDEYHDSPCESEDIADVLDYLNRIRE